MEENKCDNLPREKSLNILCLKIYLPSIGRCINEMWDAFDNLRENPLTNIQISSK